MTFRCLVIACALATVAVHPVVAQCPDGSPPPCGVRPAATASTSIAVLPFENRSPDTADVYLAEGMADEIANQLARVGRLQVKARSLVATQWRRTPDPLEAARRLNVAWIVHGYVRRAATQLLVNVELVRTSSGVQTWAARFPRRDSDVFAVQAEVAESVAVAVGGRLSPREQAVLARRPTQSNEAYRLYLLGNSLVTRRTAADIRRGIEAYERATRLDPNFAAAWARIAIARDVQSSYDTESGPRDTLVARARAAVRRAMAIDSTAPDVLVADGVMARDGGDLARARRSLERAVQLDTLNEEALGQLASLYVNQLIDKSRAEPLLRRVLALNPDRKVSWLHLYYLRWFSGNLAAAAAVLDSLHALGKWAPAYGARAELRFCMGDGAGALADLSEYERLDGNQYPRSRAMYSVAAGDSAPALALVARWRADIDSGKPFPLPMLARFYLTLGRRADALDALERAHASGRFRSMWGHLHWACFAPLRSDPRFQRLLEENRPRVP